MRLSSINVNFFAIVYIFSTFFANIFSFSPFKGKKIGRTASNRFCITGG